MTVNSHTCRELKDCNIFKTNTTNSFLDENCAVLDYFAASSGNLFRYFGTTHRSHLQKSRIQKKSCCPNTGACIGKIVGSVKSQ
jgi:hypothetical protein